MLKKPLFFLDRILTNIEKFSVFVSFTALIMLSSSQIALRTLEYPIPVWISPLSHQMVLFSGLIGASLAVRSKEHLTFDLITTTLLQEQKHRLQIIISLISALICFFISKAAFIFVKYEQETMNEFFGIPSWLFPSVMPLSFLFMGIHFILDPFIKPCSTEQKT